MNRAMKHIAQCAECERVFDLLNEEEAGEWYYGHDCELLTEEPKATCFHGHDKCDGVIRLYSQMGDIHITTCGCDCHKGN